MLFSFLKYVQPTQYFSILKKDGSSVFPIVSELPSEILAQLEKDTKFKSELAANYDLSWQAIQKGYVGEANTYQTFNRLAVVDEYRFIRKYFNPMWALYILMLRVIGFKNPFKEIGGWVKSKDTKRSSYLKTPIKHDGWNSFSSSMLKTAPLVSVIIPTLNRYPYLKDVIEDLEKQDYPNYEVIIVDQTEPFQEEFYKQFKKPLRVYYQEEKALWLARNFAVKESKGDLFLLFDDDSRIEKDWISNHVKCLDYFNAEVSSGVSISQVGAKVPENYSFLRLSDQIDTGNVLIKRVVFEKVGLFDRQFEKQRMGDGEFGLRSHLAGFLNISNPYAERLHLKVGSGGLRQMGSWDGFRPKKWFGPRPIPSVVYYFRNYYGKQRTRLSLLRTVPPSVIPYRFKGSNKMMLLGAFVSLLLFPVVLFQVFKSWRLASVKLKEGHKIEYLSQ